MIFELYLWETLGKISMNEPVYGYKTVCIIWFNKKLQWGKLKLWFKSSTIIKTAADKMISCTEKYFTFSNK